MATRGTTRWVRRLGDGLGKCWNAPNSAVGVSYGAAGWALGWCAWRVGRQAVPPAVRWGDNALQFTGNPLACLGAITLGNVQVYGPSCGPDHRAADGNRFGTHELQHTVQGQWLGPLYLPSNLLGGLAGVMFGGHWHAPQNWNERGPQRRPPRPWG